jgi:outer membrane receptor for ferric coprogen and ferric-rhodotorulic acid
MDMAMYERVEIVRGAAGLLHGTGNPAATVNLVPKRPTREFSGSAGLTLGSWGRRRAEADVGGPLNASGSLRARVVATQEERDFFYDVAGERTGNLYAIAELDLARGTTVHAGVHHQRIRSTTNMAGVPFYADGRATPIWMPPGTASTGTPRAALRASSMPGATGGRPGST